MAKRRSSSKRIAIDKDQTRIVAMIAGAAAIVIFSVVASRTLTTKLFHQNRVISAKKEALTQLNINLSEVEKLESSYRTFDDALESVLGNTDERNSKIILDALPSKYDYPALLASIEGFVADTNKYSINSIDGQDQELEVQQVSPEPQPIEMPVTLDVTSSYQDAQTLVANIYKSIRPLAIRNIQISSDNSNQVNLSLDLTTYYQPETNLEITKKDIE